MAVRTFDQTLMTKLLIKICALNCTVGHILLLLHYKTIVDYGDIEYDVLFTREYQYCPCMSPMSANIDILW